MIPRIPRERVTPEIPVFLHPPRTGGQARAAAFESEALAGRVYLAPHGAKASDFPVNDVIQFVREPVQRYMSVFWRFQKGLPREITAAQAMALPKPEYSMFWLARLQQVYWANSPHVRLYPLYLMDKVLPELADEFGLTYQGLPELGDPARNESDHAGVISRRDLDYIRMFYPEDRLMWARVRGDSDLNELSRERMES